MMINEQKRAKLQELIDQGYDFKFGEYMTNAFGILQKKLGLFIGFFLLYIIVTSVVGSIPFIGQIANSLVIGPAAFAGIFIVCNRIDRGEDARFEDFFKGFDYVSSLAIAALLTSAIALASVAPMVYFAWQYGLVDWYYNLIVDPMSFSAVPDIPFWIFIFILPGIYLSVAYSWVYPFIVFYKLPAWEAMEMSRQLITKKWFTYFGYSLVMGIIAVSGVLLFGIGVIFTIPLIAIAPYTAFADVTELNSEMEDDITDHLIV